CLPSTRTPTRATRWGNTVGAAVVAQPSVFSKNEGGRRLFARPPLETAARTGAAPCAQNVPALTIPARESASSRRPKAYCLPSLPILCPIESKRGGSLL